MSIRIEQYDGDEVWARSDFPTDLITLDYNAQGGLIGIALLGPAARRASEALVKSVIEDDDPEVRQKLAPIFA